MRNVVVALVLAVGFLFCFNAGFDTAEEQNLSEMNELLESNIRLQILLNIYEQNYGTLTEKDAELYLEKKDKALMSNHNGRIGPI